MEELRYMKHGIFHAHKGDPLHHCNRVYTAPILLLKHHLIECMICHKVLESQVPSPLCPHLWVQADRYKHNLRLQGGWMKKAAEQGVHIVSLGTALHMSHQTCRSSCCICWCGSHTGHPCILQDESSEKQLGQNSSTRVYAWKEADHCAGTN